MSYAKSEPKRAGQPDGWNEAQGDDPDAALVVLDDANLGIRDAEALWPKAIRPGSGRCPCVLLFDPRFHEAVGRPSSPA